MTLNAVANHEKLSEKYLTILWQLMAAKADTGKMVAQELRDAQLQLAEITGQVTSDELLGRIFGHFCIGK